MASTVARLVDRGLARPPRWLPSNVQFETIMGSVAYGVSSDTSDMDVYGWVIPPRDEVFPHLRGEILGFGKPSKRFEVYQEHHLIDGDALGGKGRSYDLTIFGIVKFFALAMENNPNVLDSLFTNTECVLHSTRVGNLVRDNRRRFLHKGAWAKFKGYAYSQLHKIAIKEPVGARAELVAAHGYDTKFAYHVVRLIGEVEQILVEQDVDLQRDRELLKAIRRGEWTEPRLRQWFADKRVAARTDLRREHAPGHPRRGGDQSAPAGVPRRALREPGSLPRRTRPPGRRPPEYPGGTGPDQGLALNRGRPGCISVG